MKLAIIGVEDSGRATIFQALTQRGESGPRESRVAAVRVPDPRVDQLSALYRPKKTTFAQVEYSLPAAPGGREGRAESAWTEVRPADALIVVARNFGNGKPAAPLVDARRLEADMVFADFMVVEKRLERLEADRKRGKPGSPREQELLLACKAELEKDRPLRLTPELAEAPELRGFTFLSAKPLLLLFNNPEEDAAPPSGSEGLGSDRLVVRGKLEAEIAAMVPEERSEFLAEYGIAESAMDRVIRRSYELLGLTSFFTVGEDEVKAWTIPRGTAAVAAASEIHSDIQKGFIRAEVVSYEELMAAGSQAEARKRGKFRLEGKTYEVADGDIINFRFNV